ncbi:hypothetical protein RN001_004931 [Aquatica leii]|uniref:tRNA-binding domain-containing protein n=1 Tax=Aquatica leii TaxID=1421715 RepID=A0AAN7SHP1_9COLE|nr:hypothetical protein RN001_004931 [Aquatica leii]
MDQLLLPDGMLECTAAIVGNVGDFVFKSCIKTVKSNKLLKVLNMSAKTALEIVKRNAAQAEKTITELKNELEELSTTYNNLRYQQLQNENKQLSLAVEAAKNHLIGLEVKNGVKQIGIALNGSKNFHTTTQENKQGNNIEIQKADKKKINKKKNVEPSEKKPIDDKPDIVDVGRLDLRIAKIEHVEKHPDADTLYVLKINCGEDKPRTVCSGLVKFIPIEELRNINVLLLCNLKPAKMRGITSEAMIMCASRPDAIEVLIPPAGCIPGEPVHCTGYTRNPDLIMPPKKKIFETVVPDLQTNDLLQACYKGVPFDVPGKGNIMAKTLKNCPIK